MAMVDLIGVPFDGFGRRGHQARAAAALRDAGLEAAFPGHDVTLQPDLDLPEPKPERGTVLGLMNEAALLAVTDELNRRVSESVAAGRFPFVYGGDCSGLVGAYTGLRDAAGDVGLLFVDGHEDTTPLDSSDVGEAANAELGLLLGITGQLPTVPFRPELPALKFEALAMLGPRDDDLRRELNVASLRDRGVWYRRHDEVAAAPAEIRTAAVAHILQSASGWWLHTDLDVLAQDEFVAQLVPGDVAETGGLRWPQLTDLVATALRSGGALGWSLAIYDPDQDPDGHEARRIVEFVRTGVASMP